MNITQCFEYLNTHSCKDIFNGDIEEKYLKLATICHPDKNIGNEEFAKECFQLLVNKYKALKNPVTIGKYKIFDKFQTGDICDLFLTENNLLKICCNPKYNKYLQNEYNLITELQKQAGKLSLYFPKIIEKIQVKDKIIRECNIFAYESDYQSINKLHHEKNELKAEHIAWIYKRLLATVAFSHQQGILHLGIIPPHFLINTQNHGGRLIDWTQSVRIGMPPTLISSAYNWYPTEILNKKAYVESDVYMLGKFGLWLIGSQKGVCDKFRSFFESMTMNNYIKRPDNVANLYCEFDELLTKLFGKKKFIKWEN